MIITYYGTQCFKIQYGETVLAFNPVSKDSKIARKPKFGSNIVFVTTKHSDYNGIENTAFGEKEPFVIDGPGEYEVSGIFVKGYFLSTHKDGKEIATTAFDVEFEDMKLVFVGGFPFEGDVPGEIKSELVDPDILFISLESGFDPGKAHKFATSLEAKVVIPMEYDDALLSQFLKHSGMDQVSPQDKLTIKKKDVSTKMGEVVVLEVQ